MYICEESTPPLIKSVNKQKQRWLMYLIWSVFVGITLLVLYYSSASILSENQSSTTISQWGVYLITNSFLLISTLFFFWKTFRELRTNFKEEGIETYYLFSPQIIKWESVNKITVYEHSGQPFKFEIQSDGGKLVIIALFYKNPSALMDLFKYKVSSKVTWEYSKLNNS